MFCINIAAGAESAGQTAEHAEGQCLAGLHETGGHYPRTGKPTSATIPYVSRVWYTFGELLK